ncbi:MAG TPA: hypothetical protein VFI98_00905, partial [Pseudolabrys sp.]|nr:hypothetical protein [Pseudolabrys sp.]
FERELIEQRSLFDLSVSHHDLQSCLEQRLNQPTTCVATVEFFNTIGQKQPHAVRQNCGYVINDMHILERIRMGDTSPAVAMFSSRKLALRADLGKLPSLCTLLA